MYHISSTITALSLKCLSEEIPFVSPTFCPLDRLADMIYCLSLRFSHLYCLLFNLVNSGDVVL